MKLRTKKTIDKVDIIYLEKLLKGVEFKKTYAGQKLVWAALIPAAFDIEATRQFMYIWTFSIKNVTIIGYTWDDYRKLLEMLKIVLCLGVKTKTVKHRNGEVEDKHSAPYVLPIFIHNLIYEYSFMKHEFEFEKPFFKDALKKKKLDDGTFIELPQRNPLCLVNEDFFYIDSYKVCPKSLEKLAKAYCTLRKTHDLDYNIDRNCEDAKHLTEEELTYCIRDTQILVEFAEFVIENYFKKNGRLPLTQNQIVKQIITNSHKSIGTEEEDKVIRSMTMTQEQYLLVRRDGFRGGICGSSERDFQGEVIYGDETSAYFSAIMHGYYPISRYRDITAKVKTVEDIDRQASIKCCQMKLKFYNLETKSKTFKLESKDNVIRWMPDGSAPRKDKKGKIIAEDREVIRRSVKVDSSNHIWKAVCISTSMTEIDWELYKKCYIWDKVEILHFEAAQRGELPDYIKKAAIELYIEKASLKKAGIKGPKYESAKTLVSNIFGCIVKKLQDDLVKGPEANWWADQLDNILKPQWGTYITAHARKVLVDMILKLGKNWLYSDTDSVFFIKTPETVRILEEYNIQQKMKNAEICKRYNLDFNLFDDLGCFDGDSLHIIHFKTLGPKCYMYMTTDDDDPFKFVMSGIADKYFWEAYDKKFKERTEKDVFDFFESDTEIEYVRKKLVFVDKETTEVINGIEMTSKSGAIVEDDPIKGSLRDVGLKLALEKALDKTTDKRI